MQLDRILRDADEQPASSEAGAVTPPARDYRQEAADSDDQLTRELNQLAQLFHAPDVVNCGAQ